MKIWAYLFLFQVTFASADINVPENGGGGENNSAVIYNEAGWKVSDSPDAMTVMSRCQGDHCPQVLFGRMPMTSDKTYQFVLTKKEMTSNEIASRLGFSEQSDARGFHAVVLILNDIKESQARGESKNNYIRRQKNSISSGAPFQSRLLLAKVMADIADRISPN